MSVSGTRVPELTAAEAGTLFEQARHRYTIHWGLCPVRTLACPTCAALEALEDRYAALYGLLFADEEAAAESVA